MEENRQVQRRGVRRVTHLKAIKWDHQSSVPARYNTHIRSRFFNGGRFFFFWFFSIRLFLIPRPLAFDSSQLFSIVLITSEVDRLCRLPKAIQHAAMTFMFFFAHLSFAKKTLQRRFFFVLCLVLD